MTEQDKQLLSKVLCELLPYGVKIVFSHNGFRWDCEQTLEEITKCDDGEYTVNGWGIHGIKPYLRPMSSMTEEEREELSDYLCERVMSDKKGITFPPDPIHGKGIPFEWMSECLDWLNTHHFDYRGLIEKGLALEAPEGMYEF